MFERPNVELVTAGIREVRAHSIVAADGTERPVDCIVLGTGFVTDPRVYLADFPVTGHPGHTLQHDWRRGAEAYYGIHVTGFPNLHQLVGPNTGLGHNSVVFMIEAQVRYVVSAIRALGRRGADWLEVTPEAQRRFNARLQHALEGTVWAADCASWYKQDDGHNFTLWPWSTARYWLATRRLRASDYRFGALTRSAGDPQAAGTASLPA